MSSNTKVPKGTHMKTKENRINIKALALIAGFSVFAAALFAGVIALCVQNREQKMALDSAYERSFYELSDASQSLEMSLSKMLVAYDDEQTSVIAMDIYKNSESALDALTRLPLEKVDAAGAEKFYNQVADFSITFNKNIAYKLNSAAYRERIEDLYITARAINQSIMKEGEELQSNGYNFTAMMAMRSKKNRAQELADDSQSESLYQSIEYPELIYDGPFSDSTSKRPFKALENLEEISFETACEILKEKLPFKISGFELKGSSEGMAPAYLIKTATEKGEFYCSVSKKGGILLTLCSNRDTKDVVLSEEAATAKAKEYAMKMGFDVDPVWYNSIGGVATINFAPITEGIIYYTDLIKIKIALDNGDLLGAETTGYCMNHEKRDFTVSLSESDAKGKLPAHLAITSVRLAVVPYMEKCVLSYEVAAEYKGLDYFIYVDASTGKQINIMRIIDNEQGKMTV